MQLYKWAFGVGVDVLSILRTAWCVMVIRGIVVDAFIYWIMSSMMPKHFYTTGGLWLSVVNAQGKHLVMMEIKDP